MPFEVSADDNYDYLDESKCYTFGIFDTYDDAVASAKAIIDKNLISIYKVDMKFEELFQTYCGFAEDPFIQAILPQTSVTPNFSSWTYAKEKCHQMYNSKSTVS
jgi:hypothetical protein